MNTCTGPKWQLDKLWAYRLQDVQKTHSEGAEGGEKVQATDKPKDCSSFLQMPANSRIV